MMRDSVWGGSKEGLLFWKKEAKNFLLCWGTGFVADNAHDPD
jgi:hypothetical protein